jgi:hypothetical protein
MRIAGHASSFALQIYRVNKSAVSTGIERVEYRFHDFDGSPRSHRWVLTHMIEEYARHNGHADLIREAIDGAVED